MWLTMSIEKVLEEVIGKLIAYLVNSQSVWSLCDPQRDDNIKLFQLKMSCPGIIAMLTMGLDIPFRFEEN